MFDGAIQVKTTCEDEVFVSSLVNPVGKFGTLGIIAPFPVAEYEELPSEFNARTLAVTDDPDVRENGEALKTLAGIVHLVFDLTVALLTPSQFAVSCVYVLSACLIYKM